MRKLKAAQSKQDWGKGLEAFRQRHNLSLRDLSGICSTNDRLVSRDTIHRLCRGLAEPKSAERLRQIVREQLRAFLLKANKSEAEITLELRTIFCKEEIETVLTQRATLPKPAQNFFGLRQDPFTSDPRDQSEVFTTPQLDRMQAHFIDAISYQGFMAAIGEVGSGKTILKRRVMDHCARSKGKLHLLWPEFMNMEKVHSGSIASFILRKFNQPAPHDLVHRADKLKTLLAGLAEEGSKVALGFDECHRLHPNLLTALKNFWELGSGGFDRYLGLVLFGQPHFEDVLRQPIFREILERLDIIRMPSLGKNAQDYLSHRLQIAGGKLEKLFEPAAVSRLAKLANTPLALGNVANAALLEAFKLQERKVLAGFVPEKNGDPQVRGMRKAS